MSSAGTLDQIFDRPFVFRDQPVPTNADSRAIWRLPVLLLLVRACRGGKATPEQLHVLNWAVRSAENAGTLKAFLGGQIRPDDAVVRFEPALERAVALARGFGLLTWEGRYWKLTRRGEDLLGVIDDAEDTLRAEKEMLRDIGTPFTQAAVQRLLSRSAR